MTSSSTYNEADAFYWYKENPEESLQKANKIIDILILVSDMEDKHKLNNETFSNLLNGNIDSFSVNELDNLHDKLNNRLNHLKTKEMFAINVGLSNNNDIEKYGITKEEYDYILKNCTSSIFSMVEEWKYSMPNITIKLERLKEIKNKMKDDGALNII